MRGMSSAAAAAEHPVPEIIERRRGDDRQRAKADEGETPFDVQRSDRELERLGVAASGRGPDRDQRRDTHERRSDVHREMRRTPEGVATERAVPRDVPRRACPAEAEADEAQDERRELE